ncbi:hypothetical protein ACQP60_04365 [Isoptericola variabilis]|uniref:hypothetical protein n=1 Tax=Isoptericola variabilis TaxID=139208 RepID=UPI003D206833
MQAALDRREEFLRRLVEGEVGAVELWQVIRRAGLPVDIMNHRSRQLLLAASGATLPASIWL